MARTHSAFRARFCANVPPSTARASANIGSDPIFYDKSTLTLLSTKTIRREQQHPVRGRRRDARVGHENAGCAADLDLIPEQAQDLSRAVGIEIAGRLVGEHKPR